jgi:demethylmenaquinone methyltransferase/2-methoxy-6-polyprenyl-1,4-benzoquinol methylase
LKRDFPNGKSRVCRSNKSVAAKTARFARNGFSKASAGRAGVNKGDEKLDLVHRFFSGTGPSYDFMVNFATLGIDRRWKRRIVSLLPANPKRVLDLACGTGILTLAIARRYPDCRVVGVELRDEYLVHAREKVRRLGIRNVELVLSRAEDYRSREPFDCVCSSYLAKYADLPVLTRNTKAMLVDDGLLLMHDFTYPPTPLLALAWRFHLKTLQLAGSPFFPAWREIFLGLPRLIEETRWVPELHEVLRENGFRCRHTEPLTAHGSAIVTARR